MRVLCSTTAGEGHFGPLRVLAQACRAAGHEVRVAAPASFAGTVQRAGLDHVPFAEPSPEAMHAVFASLARMSTEQANATVMAEVFGRLDAQAAFPDVQRMVRTWRPDVVLRDPAELASLAAAQAAGIAHIEVAIAVAALMQWGLEHLPDPLAELDEVTGLTHGTLLQAAAASPVFTMVPEAMDRAAGHSTGTASAVRDVVRFRARHETGPGRLPCSWGNPDDPLVYVTFGTVAGGLDYLREVFTATLHALSALPVRVLLTTGAGGEVALADVPGNAHVEQFWPQDDLMPLAAAVVSHGGFGTTMSALSAGVPQVVMPLFSTDQYLNAEAVSAMGAGVTIHGGPDATSAMAAAVSRVLSESSFRIRSGEIAEQIAALPEATDVVDQIGRITDTAAPN
ncbi:glycosyltransferase [Nostocoides sp. F2B08]|uniref:glycosyltransferase n=1 Tax=Nostocoides sp. F2B08 TaxID=2653936 RepID=UPI00186AD1C0|nr:glycosyltransferase [Tetrasphaera sp. F2B08]